MTSARTPFSQAEINYLAATALPFLVIWTEPDFLQFIFQARENSASGYLLCLARYKGLYSHRKTLGVYEHAAVMREITFLETLISGYKTLPETSVNLIAAANNLLALFQFDVNDKAVAQSTLETTVKLPNLSPLSKASIHSNLAYIMLAANYNDDQQVIERALIEAEQALQCLQELELNNSRLKHIAAAIYSGLGDLYRKVEKLDLGIKTHEQALALWPENQVIRNKAVFNLLKHDTEENVKKAEAMLTADYAAQQDSFDMNFYLADANIKLAGFARSAGNSKEKDNYLVIAESYLRKAQQANENNKYEEGYLKRQARIKLIKTRLYYVDGNTRLVSIFKKLAFIDFGAYREDKQRSGKFLAKFPEVDPTKPSSFNIKMLFPKAQPKTPAVADEKPMFLISTLKNC
ncbi:MAG: hypothetical protein V4501_07525 [Pseudomonadota bacterium]